MSQHVRIEEISDSDSDPPEQDPADFTSTLIRPASIPSPQQVRPPHPQEQQQQPFSSTMPPEYKHYQCLYPIYFDASRTRSQGRRVGTDLAVQNPLAREIVDAVQLLGLKTVFEPGKIHPKDWSNPGRVRVLVKEGGKARSARVGCKQHLYTLVSAHLRAHPTTPESPLRLRIQGMPPPTLPITAPAVPRGWKINSILPLHSQALSGGGVSDNILKDVMQEMQGVAGAAQGQGQGNVEVGAVGQRRKREREGGKKR